MFYAESGIYDVNLRKALITYGPKVDRIRKNLLYKSGVHWTPQTTLYEVS